MESKRREKLTQNLDIFEKHQNNVIIRERFRIFFKF